MIYIFKDFELSTKRYELCQNGRCIELRRQPLGILIYLIRHRSRLVTHGELIWHFWRIEEGETFSRTSLSNCIKEIRRAIGDNGFSQNHIKTIHGLGYRFTATVVEHIEEIAQIEVPYIEDYSTKAIEEKVFNASTDLLDVLERYKHVLCKAASDEGLSREFYMLLVKIDKLIAPLMSKELIHHEQR